MDVVYNHTCEGGVEGPTVCWRCLLYTSTEDVLLGRQRNGANNSCARVRHRFDDLLRRLVDDLVVIGLKPDADFLLSLIHIS